MADRPGHEVRGRLRARDTVPGAAILYIRDTRSDEMLYSTSAEGQKDDTAKDEEEQDEEMERPTHVEADISPRASSPSAAAAASTDPVNMSSASTPRLRDVPDSQPLNRTSPNALLMQLQSYAAKDLSSMQDSKWRTPIAERPKARARTRASPRTRARRRASRNLSHTARGAMAKAATAMNTTKGVGTNPTTPHQAQS